VRLTTTIGDTLPFSIVLLLEQRHAYHQNHVKSHGSLCLCSQNVGGCDGGCSGSRRGRPVRGKCRASGVDWGVGCSWLNVVAFITTSRLQSESGHGVGQRGICAPENSNTLACCLSCRCVADERVRDECVSPPKPDDHHWYHMAVADCVCAVVHVTSSRGYAQVDLLIAGTPQARKHRQLAL